MQTDKHVEFFLEGTPKGKGRPRFTRMGRTYTPPETKAYEAAISHAFKCAAEEQGLHIPVFPVDVGVRLSVRIYHKPSKSTRKSTREAMLDNLIPCVRKPDIDNVLKAICDGLESWGFENDTQVTSIHAVRLWGEFPGIFVKLEEDK